MRHWPLAPVDLGDALREGAGLVVDRYLGVLVPDGVVEIAARACRDGLELLRRFEAGDAEGLFTGRADLMTAIRHARRGGRVFP